MNLIEAKFGNRAPDDLPQTLRALADAAEKGEVTSMVAAYVQNDSYCFMFGSSLEKAIVLTALLQQRNYRRMVFDE